MALQTNFTICSAQMLPHQCQPLPDDPQCDPSVLRMVFQALLKNRQATYLLVDRQHHLMAVCVDALGLLPIQAEDNNISKDVVTLLSSALQCPVIELLSKAQTTGKANCSSYQIDLSANQLCPVTILITLHTAMGAHTGTQEFLSVLIEREESMPRETAYHSRMAEIIEENNRLRTEVLAHKKNEQELVQQAQALARSNADLEEFAYCIPRFARAATGNDSLFSAIRPAL